MWRVENNQRIAAPQSPTVLSSACRYYHMNSGYVVFSGDALSGSNFINIVQVFLSVRLFAYFLIHGVISSY